MSGCGSSGSGSIPKNPFAPSEWTGPIDIDTGPPIVVYVDCNDSGWFLGSYNSPWVVHIPLNYDPATNTFSGSALDSQQQCVVFGMISNPCPV